MKPGWVAAAVLSGAVLVASPVLYLRTLLKTWQRAGGRLADPQPMPAYYGPVPAYGAPLPLPVYDREPGPPAYGVPPCGTDQECVRAHGPGWYCPPATTQCAPRPGASAR